MAQLFCLVLAVCSLFLGSVQTNQDLGETWGYKNSGGPSKHRTQVTDAPEIYMVPSRVLTCLSPAQSVTAGLIVASVDPNRRLACNSLRPQGPIALLACYMLIIQSGDIELNPGPAGPKHPCPTCDRGVRSNSKSLQCGSCGDRYHVRCTAICEAVYNQLKSDPSPWYCPACQERQKMFPCTICANSVNWDSNAFQCDGCDAWTHCACAQVGENTYQELKDCSNIWLCQGCGLPNSTALINTYNVTVSNSFDVLNEDISLDDSTILDASPNAASAHLRPQAASTPSGKGKNPFPGKSQSPRRLLKISNVNCRSVVRNRDRLGTQIDSLRPDVIIGTESFLTADIVTPTELDGYQVERRDRQTRDGGVFIAVRNDLVSTREMEYETDCELLWVKVDIVGSKTLHIGAFYRPNISDDTSLPELQKSISRIPSSHNIVLGGDLNLPDIDWHSCAVKTGSKFTSHHELLLDISASAGLTQHVTDITRIDPHHGTENTLDLIFTNRPASVISSVVAPGISDHFTPVVEMDISPVRVRKKPREVPLFKSAQWDEFAQHVRQAGDGILQAPLDADVNTLWSQFQDILHTGTKKFIKHKLHKEKIGLPYITPALRKLMRKRDRMFDRIKKTRRHVSMHSHAANLKSKYNSLKARVQKEIRQAYWQYISSIILPESGASEEQGSGRPSQPKKSFWSFIRRNRTEKVNVAALKCPSTGKLITDATGKADNLNHQFQSVFTQETPITTEHTKPQLFPDIGEIVFTEPGIRKLLKGLDPSKAAGPDQILPRVLYELADSVAPLLTDIFNRSYRTGVVPSEWRHANVVPAYKKGKKFMAVNYRPISLTCVCCKLMEHVVARQIMRHSDEHGILYDLQHGFRSKLSCETQLIELSHDLASNLQAGHQTDMLVMDFSKAFDKVGHARLMLKLEHYGITGKTYRWTQAFLSDRTQVVVVDGEQSSRAPVTSGVPQGSVLGPCLFLFFINDLAEEMHSTVRLFADDTIAYLTVEGDGDAARLQQDLDKLAHWEALWQMEFHPEKCYVLRVSKKHKQNIHRHDYILHGHTLEVTDKVKYLGLTIASDLSWGSHLDNICKKANSIQAVLKRNIRVSDQNIKAAAYKSLVRPHVEYCSTVWDPHTKTQKAKIEMVQRRAARWVFSKYRWGPNTTGPSAMIESLGWQSLEARRKIARLCMLYKMKHHLVLMTYRSLLIPYAHLTKAMPPHAYTPLDKSPLKLYYAMSFLPRTVAEWNLLPCSVAAAPTLEIFKTSVTGLLA